MGRNHRRTVHSSDGVPIIVARARYFATRRALLPPRTSASRTFCAPVTQRRSSARSCCPIEPLPLPDRRKQPHHPHREWIGDVPMARDQSQERQRCEGRQALVAVRMRPAEPGRERGHVLSRHGTRSRRAVRKALAPAPVRRDGTVGEDAPPPAARRHCRCPRSTSSWHARRVATRGAQHLRVRGLRPVRQARRARRCAGPPRAFGRPPSQDVVYRRRRRQSPRRRIPLPVSDAVEASRPADRCRLQRTRAGSPTHRSRRV